MATKSGTLTRRLLRIIASYENDQMEALTIGPYLDNRFLALFSYKEEAEAILSLLGDGEKEKAQKGVSSL